MPLKKVGNSFQFCAISWNFNSKKCKQVQATKVFFIVTGNFRKIVNLSYLIPAWDIAINQTNNNEITFRGYYVLKKCPNRNTHTCRKAGFSMQVLKLKSKDTNSYAPTLNCKFETVNNQVFSRESVPAVL